MPRISGLEKRQAPWHPRWFYRDAENVWQGSDAGEAADAAAFPRNYTRASANISLQDS